PARILKNWFKIIASSLIRSQNKTLKFSYGEVNYIMTSRKTGEVDVVAENGDFALTVEPIWDNEEYRFTRKQISSDQIQLIKQNLNGYVEFQDRDDTKMQGFIQSIDYDANEHTADFTLLKVYRP